MKSFKTLLLLTATLSGSLLAACGVDSTDTSSETQVVQTEQSYSVQSMSENDAVRQCIGAITCGTSSSTVLLTVACKMSSSTAAACTAACPPNTTYKGGSCSLVTVDPPPPSSN